VASGGPLGYAALPACSGWATYLPEHSPRATRHHAHTHRTPCAVLEKAYLLDSGYFQRRHLRLLRKRAVLLVARNWAEQQRKHEPISDSRSCSVGRDVLCYVRDADWLLSAKPWFGGLRCPLPPPPEILRATCLLTRRRCCGSDGGRRWNFGGRPTTHHKLTPAPRCNAAALVPTGAAYQHVTAYLYTAFNCWALFRGGGHPPPPSSRAPLRCLSTGAAFSAPPPLSN